MNFGDYANYYNALYEDKDYSKEAKDVDFLLSKYKTGIKNVIIFGCGTGKHDRELYRLGYKCHGIDLSSEMISEARKGAEEAGMKIEYEVSDIRTYRSELKYDSVVSLFHVFSYQTTNKDITDAFISARNVLDKGGLFLFDVWYGPGVLSDKPAVRIKEAETCDKRIIRLCKPVMHDEANVVDVNYELLVLDKKSSETISVNETHRMRYYFKPEIEKYLEICGFRLLGHFDCNTLENTDYNSWTCYFIAVAV